MKLINFKIANDNIALTTSDYYFDLHNNYDLLSFEYQVKKRKFWISWIKSDEDWVDKRLPYKLKLEFTNTSFLKIKENEKDEFIKDDNCLEAIGFAECNMRDNMDSWLSEWREDDNYDLIFIFINGHAIKINAETAELEIRLINNDN